jgi:hypothetical protein
MSPGKEAAAFIVISRRKKSCRKAAEKPPSGHKAAQRTKKLPPNGQKTGNSRLCRPIYAYMEGTAFVTAFLEPFSSFFSM